MLCPVTTFAKSILPQSHIIKCYGFVMDVLDNVRRRRSSYPSNSTVIAFNRIGEMSSVGAKITCFNKHTCIVLKKEGSHRANTTYFPQRRTFDMTRAVSPNVPFHVIQFPRAFENLIFVFCATGKGKNEYCCGEYG